MNTVIRGRREDGPPFCPYCGSILYLPESGNIVCGTCGYKCGYRDLNNLTSVTFSKEEQPPQWLRSLGVTEKATGPARATVEEACPTCNNPEMEFYTMQLRSADEGQTVFYECKKCGHKFSVNT